MDQFARISWFDPVLRHGICIAQNKEISKRCREKSSTDVSQEERVGIRSSIWQALQETGLGSGRCAD